MALAPYTAPTSPGATPAIPQAQANVGAGTPLSAGASSAYYPNLANILGQLAQTSQQGYNTAANTQLQNLGALQQAQAAGQNQLANTSLVGQNQLQNTALTNAGNLQNTQQSGLNTLANTGLSGQYSLAGQDLAGQYQLANTGLGGQYNLAAAETSQLAPLIGQSIALQKFNSLFPYVTGLLGTMESGGYLNPSLGQVGQNGGLTLPSGSGAVAPVNVPSSVISPRQAARLQGNSVNQGNAGVLNSINALRSQDVASGAGTGSPLESQLSSQLAAQNQANLQNAATSFLGSLAPANAQQSLGFGQLGELQQQNLTNEQLNLLGQQTQRYGGLLGLISGLGSSGGA